MDKEISVQQMLDGAKMQGKLIGPVVQQVQSTLQSILVEEDARKLQKIYVTGCGESFFAGLTSNLFLKKVTGLPVEPMDAFEFRHYEMENASEDSLVIIMSNSGSSPLIGDLTREANERNLTTLAITGNANGRLAQLAHKVVLQSVQDHPDLAEGVEPTLFQLGTYLVGLVTLKLVGLSVGLLRGYITEKELDKAISHILRVPDILDATWGRVLPIAREHSKQLKDQCETFVLGAGPSIGTAMYSASKFVEMPKCNSIPQQLEEWAHGQVFITSKNTQVCLILPPGLARARGLDQIEGIRNRKGNAIVIGDSEDDELLQSSSVYYPIVGRLPEELSGLTYFLPLQVLSICLCEALGKPAKLVEVTVATKVDE